MHTEDAGELRQLLATARAMGWQEDHQQLVAPLQRLAMLELRAAVLGEDLELLRKRMEEARERQVEAEELKRGEYRRGEMIEKVICYIT